jgi:hypothetical protein
MKKHRLAKRIISFIIWLIVLSVCFGQVNEEWIQALRLRPKFPVPTTSHPVDLEEAKRWVKEAFYANREGWLARKLNKPESVWKGYYRQAAKLARGVYEKFGNIWVIWLVPEEEWAEFGDILLFPKDIWQDYKEIMRKGHPTPHFPAPDLYFALALQREAWSEARERGKVIRHYPTPCSSSACASLREAYLALGEWKEAIRFMEAEVDDLPYPVLEVSLREWLSCAQRVYPKGQIPTRWLLIKREETDDEVYILPLRERKENFFVPLWRIGWLLGWKMDEEGDRVIFEGAGKKCVIEVRRGEIVVQGERVVTKGRAYQEGLEVWVPMEFLERIVVVQITKVEGYLEVQIGQRGKD